MLLGFTGTRGAGKTTIANLLVEHFGFTKLHAFGPGKAATVAYFQHLGIDPATAYRCVYGDLKDVEHPLIPGDGLPRTFMEEFGKFMGVTLGPDYTLGAEIARAKRVDPKAKFVIESVVYEAAYFKKLGGFIIRVERAQNEGKIVGMHTDDAVNKLIADFRFSNNSDDMAETLLQLGNLVEFLTDSNAILSTSFPDVGG